MTDPWLAFDPIVSIPVVTLAAIVLAILFAGLEWEKNYRYRLIRIGSQIFLIASLVALVLRPAIRSEYSGDGIILLTSNFNKQQADSLKQLYPSLKIKRTHDASSYGNADVMLSEHTSYKELKNIRFVLGDGLPLSALDVSEANFAFLRGQQPQGITSLHFINKCIVNHPATLTGALNNFYHAKQISLEGPGGVEDSTQLNSDPSTAFELSFTPKQSGRFVYSIVVKDQRGSILEKQPLPVTINREEKLRVLILQNYPTAEVRYLKNFLSDQNHHITLRYQLSRNIFRYEYANADQTKIDRLDSRFLKNFDVCFVDSDVLQKMNVFEREQLIESVKSGLGVILLFNEVPSQNKFLRELSAAEFISQKNDTAHISLIGKDLIQLKTLGESIRPYDELQPLLQTTSGKIFSGFNSIGFGKIGFQLITETYRFVIEGKTELYAALWSPLLQKTSRKKQLKFTTQIITPEPIYPNDPVDIEIISVEDQPTLYTDSIHVPLTEDVVIDNRWLGKAWFGKPGWHTLTVPEDSTLTNLYIHQPESWKSVNITNQQIKNGLVHSTTDKPASQTEIVYHPISPWIFFALFLFASGFLWLAPKL